VLTRSELAGNFSFHPYSSDEKPFGNEGHNKEKKLLQARLYIILVFISYVLLLIITLSSLVPLLGL
jgi:hypothetical protein